MKNVSLTIIIMVLVIAIILIFVYKNCHVEKYIVTENVYCFWTGNNPLSEKRKKCLLKIKEKLGMNVILVTPENLNKYIFPEHPLHPSYQYLSETHKSDYLRTYFMHFYGGAYSDIKDPSSSWVPAYSELNENKNMYANGIKEQQQADAAIIPDDINLHNEIQKNWKKLIQTCGFIFKKNTPFTLDWYNNMMKKMDTISDKLKQYPATYPQEIYSKNYPYPLRWTELLGEIYHPLCLKYQNNILQNVPVYNNYDNKTYR